MIDVQPSVQNELVLAIPLQDEHFETLYRAAADPLIWEQHPNQNRWQKPVFETYFQGAMESGGALLVSDALTKEVIGCSRFYDYNEQKNSISIGYTFFVRSRWGTGHNYALKKLMLDHIFQFVDAVHFYIGANNKRSQLSLERFGGVKTHEEETAYYGETRKLDFVYLISKEKWQVASLGDSVE
jgi:RimJ/RimL family protein N-acetyltransferase